MRRPVFFLLLLLVLLVAAGGLNGGAAPASSTLTVAGLAEPVEILGDRWGLNHIYARNDRGVTRLNSG